MAINPALFKSSKSDWGSPKELYDRYNRICKFTLDAAASAKNAKCKRYLGPGSSIAEDALTTKWGVRGKERIWLNWPYSRSEVKNARWLKRAFTEYKKRGQTVVILGPARTCRKWWTRLVVPYLAQKAAEGKNPFDYIEFIEGRLRFELAPGRPAEYVAPFPSFVLVLTDKDLSNVDFRS